MNQKIGKDFAFVEKTLSEAIGQVTPAAQLCVHWQGQRIFSRAYGWLDPAIPEQAVDCDTLFDLASVTKLFTTTAFMTLVEEGKTGLDQPVSIVLPGFNGLRPIQPYEDPLDWSGTVDDSGGERGPVDTGQITFRQLLTHTAGLPAWRPLFNTANAPAAREMALSTFFACLPGTRVIYSDIGLILLGMAVEALAGLPLDEAIRTRVTGQLGLVHTHFFRVLNREPGNVAPTEFCGWRKRRIVGEVHDENAWQLGGVSGHAGLFANAEDLAVFGQMYLDGGRPLLHSETVAEMTRLQAQEGDTRRGIGFHLWSPDPEASSHPFSRDAFGHTGFTGTCLWIDPRRELVVAFLTNEVYNGRSNRKILPLRVAVNQAIVDAVNGKE